MKFYYIDDTMFQGGQFQEEIRYRFLRLLQRKSVKAVFISASHKENDRYQQFVKELAPIPVLRSPALFDVDGICGNLHTTFLGIEGYPPQDTFSGSCVEFDDQKMSATRVYLDLFMSHHEEESFDFSVEELEKVIQDKILGMKKKSDPVN